MGHKPILTSKIISNHEHIWLVGSTITASGIPQRVYFVCPCGKMKRVSLELEN